MHPEEDAARLIDCIYAALLGEVTWEQFMAELSVRLPGGRGSMFYFDKSSTRGAVNVSAGLDLSRQRDFAQHYSRINPLMQKALLRPPGIGTVSEQMTPWQDLKRTEFYGDFMRPMDCHAAIGLTLARTADRYLFFTVLTSEVDANANLPHARLLTLLAPHLRRAFDYYRRTAARDAIGAVGSSLLDAQSVGSIVVGEDRRVVLVSRAAERFVAEGTSVRIAGGKVHIPNERAGAMLEAMCARDRPAARTATYVVGPNRVTLIRAAKDSSIEFFQGPTVIVTIEPLCFDEGDWSPELLRAAFGVTGSEARVLAALATGETLRQIALGHRVSLETVRTQAKSIYAKLGVSGRAELQARLRARSLRNADRP